MQISSSPSRRRFLKSSTAALAATFGSGFAGRSFAQEAAAKAPDGPLFKISLAQWSLNKRYFKRGGDEPLDNLDFAKTAKQDFEIDAIEYVNQMFKDKARDEKYLGEMKKRADDEGVTSLLIMVDGEGALGDADETKRAQAIENHVKWLEAAKFLGCHSIRVNAQSSGSYDEQIGRAADGLHRLSEKADEFGLNCIVENHGGLSSNGAWLAAVMEKADHPRCGTLPDFGNFRISKDDRYDHYKGVAELMPYAKAVSAKSFDWDTGAGELVTEGHGIQIDFKKMLGIVFEAGYHGYIGIEYEGGKHKQMEGVALTKAAMVKARAQLEEEMAASKK